ncbi:MAG: 2-hydroxyacid dehydrogenase [Actinobacteria bacterium]|nr:2-hydroxyacid dehydrogenase [Actinomycetota bacterium]
MTVTVLVPNDEGHAAVAAVDGADPIRYDPERDGWPEEGLSAEVLVIPPWSRTADRLLAAMRELPKLRMVQTLSAGTDLWDGRLPDGVLLVNARGAHGGATAELAITGLLAVYRQVPGFVADQAAHRWDQHPTETLDGKRVLILGAGDLGQSLRARLEPFGATATLVGRTARAGVHGFDEVPGLLAGHDAVVLMVPSNEQTHHLADAAFLARLPDQAVVVNVARGPVVDTEALLAELTAGRLRAVLDVTDPEPLPPDHPLWDAPGLVIFPHVGGNTEGMTDRAWQVAAGQIEAFAAGQDPPNLVSQ